MTVDAIAMLLDEARRSRRAIDPPIGLDTLPLAAAYDVQDAVVRLRERDGARSG